MIVMMIERWLAVMSDGGDNGGGVGDGMEVVKGRGVRGGEMGRGCMDGVVVGYGELELVVVDIVTWTSTTTTQSSVGARRLILLRHAKSSWENRSIRDHDRPLSRAGQLDAIKVSQNLLKLGWIPQLILSSDALRTRETLKIMQDQVQAFLEAEVHFFPAFILLQQWMGRRLSTYVKQFVNTRGMRSLQSCEFSFCLGWEEAASMFSGVTVELKTCNAALLEATGKSWEEAFSLAGPGGWKLQGLVKPDTAV
ncbi:hypothetical protein RND71_011004 [Anisodus tanguticus]|uniref:Uncharacterized protein n=1 Tax=Anisodus tanguticus TaxID=243964 RepID=A0AAE1VSL5_9SOLA|nr:hypothetical protein RND71_011004 [Anisodus tanguticus]